SRKPAQIIDRKVIADSGIDHAVLRWVDVEVVILEAGLDHLVVCRPEQHMIADDVMIIVERAGATCAAISVPKKAFTNASTGMTAKNIAKRPFQTERAIVAGTLVKAMKSARN